jgi:hypothetical protein
VYGLKLEALREKVTALLRDLHTQYRSSNKAKSVEGFETKKKTKNQQSGQHQLLDDTDRRMILSVVVVLWEAARILSNRLFAGNMTS